MPMDDGLQFANTQKVERTQPMWVVAAYSKRGELIVPVPNFFLDRETAMEAMGTSPSWLSPTNRDYHIRVLLPEHEYRTDAITEEEYAAMQAVEEPEQEEDSEPLIYDHEVGYITREDAGRSSDNVNDEIDENLAAKCPLWVRQASERIESNG